MVTLEQQYRLALTAVQDEVIKLLARDDRAVPETAALAADLTVLGGRGRSLVRFRNVPPVTGLEPIRPFFTDIPNARKETLEAISAGRTCESP